MAYYPFRFGDDKVTLSAFLSSSLHLILICERILFLLAPVFPSLSIFYFLSSMSKSVLPNPSFTDAASQCLFLANIASFPFDYCFNFVREEYISVPLALLLSFEHTCYMLKGTHTLAFSVRY
jgi:hypothetical protein